MCQHEIKEKKNYTSTPILIDTSGDVRDFMPTSTLTPSTHRSLCPAFARTFTTSVYEYGGVFFSLFLYRAPCTWHIYKKRCIWHMAHGTLHMAHLPDTMHMAAGTTRMAHLPDTMHMAHIPGTMHIAPGTMLMASGQSVLALVV